MSIFVDVNGVADLALLLLSFTEDDLVKYDRESRQQIVSELQALCLRFHVQLPLYLIRAGAKDDIYDAQARLRGITPRSMIDIVNEDFGTSFTSLVDFRRWLRAQSTPAWFVNDERDAEEE